MKQFLALFLSLLSIGAAAQKKHKAAEQFSKTITAAELRHHLFIVAAPDMEGRETGTEGQRKAAAYLKEQFAKLGLQPGNNGSWEQFYPIYQDTLINAGFSVSGTEYQLGKDFAAALTSINSGKIFASEVVYLSKNDTTTDIKGKVVLLAGPQPARNVLMKLMNNQPAAILFMQSGWSSG